MVSHPFSLARGATVGSRVDSLDHARLRRPDKRGPPSHETNPRSPADRPGQHSSAEGRTTSAPAGAVGGAHYLHCRRFIAVRFLLQHSADSGAADVMTTS